jgi:hypothetical protein
MRRHGSAATIYTIVEYLMNGEVARGNCDEGKGVTSRSRLGNAEKDKELKEEKIKAKNRTNISIVAFRFIWCGLISLGY